MVLRIVTPHDFQMMAIRKLHHPFDELCPKTGVLRTVVEIDHQLPNVSVLCMALIPPLLKTIRNKITGLARRPKDDGQQISQHVENAEGHQFLFVFHVVIVGLGRFGSA